MLDQIESLYRQSERGLSYIDNQADADVYVLLHGISSGAKSWVKQFVTLKESCRLIAWDAPGYGKSAGLLTSTPTAQDYALQIKQLLDELEIRTPVTVVGHSLGAMMAAAFAKLYPEQTKKLVLVNPAQGYGSHASTDQERVYRMRPELLKRLGPAGMAKERGPRLLAQPTPFNLEVVQAVSAGLTQQGLTQASYLLAYDSIDWYLNSLSMPIPLCYGEKDSITPPEGMFDLKQKYPNLELIPLAAAGHLAYLDQPALFNQQVFQI
ncbi:alpha/beta fold hydrolase [Paenalcaligenes hominis]|uniref:alpha/beta fold hydrolase n=1 Tax=Paenalcaligenes hominis TaxID=643674 RepID=UPI003524D442